MDRNFPFGACSAHHCLGHLVNTIVDMSPISLLDAAASHVSAAMTDRIGWAVCICKYTVGSNFNKALKYKIANYQTLIRMGLSRWGQGGCFFILLFYFILLCIFLKSCFCFVMIDLFVQL
jgi:hypothetical protein